MLRRSVRHFQPEIRSVSRPSCRVQFIRRQRRCVKKFPEIFFAPSSVDGEYGKKLLYLIRSFDKIILVHSFQVLEARRIKIKRTQCDPVCYDSIQFLQPDPVGIFFFRIDPGEIQTNMRKHVIRRRVFRFPALFLSGSFPGQVSCLCRCFFTCPYPRFIQSFRRTACSKKSRSCNQHQDQRTPQ